MIILLFFFFIPTFKPTRLAVVQYSSGCRTLLISLTALRTEAAPF
jgi:hypothetical protein